VRRPSIRNQTTNGLIHYRLIGRGLKLLITGGSILRLERQAVHAVVRFWTGAAQAGVSQDSVSARGRGLGQGVVGVGLIDLSHGCLL
jgi:hypothetical protein